MPGRRDRQESDRQRRIERERIFCKGCITFMSQVCVFERERDRQDSDRDRDRERESSVKAASPPCAR